MNTHCPFCGVKYKESSEVFTVDCQPKTYTSNHHDIMFITERNDDMCYWCACNIPIGIVDVAKERDECYCDYTIKNWKEYPSLKERIENLTQSILSSSCPKCKEKLKEVYSEWAEENIKKCYNCGWC